LDLLRDGLDDPVEAVACGAADALRNVGGRASMAALYRGCADGGALGEHAADALAEIAARVGSGRHDELLLIIGDSWPHEGPLARNLCRVVGKLGIVDYVPPLVSMLGSSDAQVRVAAAHALGHIEGDHEGVGALCFALADEEQHVRAGACRSLGLLASPQSCQPLLSATADPSALVRAAAVQALVAIDNPVALARMREIVLDDPSPTVVVQAIAGLGSSRVDQDLNLLMSLCSSEDHEVVKAAARALTHFGAHRATAALLGLLSHDRWDVRWAAAEVLAGRGDVTALAPLRRALQVESDELVRDVLGRAVESLAQLAGESTAG
jgi:HEAT repeat protein